MKNSTKRIVAFLLMICMLCAVMAPTALAVTVDEETGTITYTYTGASGNADLAADAYGDITILGKSSGTMKDKETYLQANSFSSSRWIAFSVDVETAGKYAVTVSTGGATAGADVYFFSGDADYADKINGLTVDSNEYIGTGYTASNAFVAHAMTETVDCVEGTNVFLLKGSSTSTGNFRFNKIALTPVEEAAEQTFEFNADKMTNWSHIKSSGTFKTTSGKIYAVNDTAGEIMSLQLNEVVAGTYRLDFTISNHNAGSLHNVYILPAAEVDTSSVATIKESLTNSIGTVQFGAKADGVPAEQRIPYFTFENTGAYVLVFEAAEDGRPDLAGLTITPIEKVVNGTYYTVADAIDANVTNIQLTGDLTEDVALKNGVTLDLNGKTIYGNVVVANGQIEGNGSVVGTLDATGNKWLPIKTAENTYSFYEVTYKQNGYSESSVTASSVDFWFDLDMDADVYDLVKNGEFTIAAKLTWTGNETGVTVDLSGKVNEWLAYKDSAENRGLGVQVTGLEGLESGNEVTVTPVFENTETGVSGLFGGAITYTIP